MKATVIYQKLNCFSTFLNFISFLFKIMNFFSCSEWIKGSPLLAVFWNPEGRGSKIVKPKATAGFAFNCSSALVQTPHAIYRPSFQMLHKQIQIQIQPSKHCWLYSMLLAMLLKYSYATLCIGGVDIGWCFWRFFTVAATSSIGLPTHTKRLFAGEINVVLMS